MGQERCICSVSHLVVVKWVCTSVKIFQAVHLRFAILLCVMTSQKYSKNDSRPSLAHIFCGMYMIPIDKCPDLAASHCHPYVISGANI